MTMQNIILLPNLPLVTIECLLKPPQPVAPWEGVKDASFYGSECAQLRLITGDYAGHEDCLFLNIFVPKVIFYYYAKFVCKYS